MQERLIFLGIVYYLLAAIHPLAAEDHSLINKAGPMNNSTTTAAAMDEKSLRAKLTPEQYHVTRENGTEPPFKNAYWDNKHPGIYVDLISGVPLFSSLDKYDSGTGWPSFTKPLKRDALVEKKDNGWFVNRTEIRSKASDLHLGHVFNDGPAPSGLRYCMNSAALRFIPVEDLEKFGYGEYKKLFETK